MALKNFSLALFSKFFTAQYFANINILSPRVPAGAATLKTPAVSASHSWSSLFAVFPHCVPHVSLCLIPILVVFVAVSLPLCLRPYLASRRGHAHALRVEGVPSYCVSILGRFCIWILDGDEAVSLRGAPRQWTTSTLDTRAGQET